MLFRKKIALCPCSGSAQLQLPAVLGGVPLLVCSLPRTCSASPALSEAASSCSGVATPRSHGLVLYLCLEAPPRPWSEVGGGSRCPQRVWSAEHRGCTIPSPPGDPKFIQPVDISLHAWVIYCTVQEPGHMPLPLR